MKLRLGDLFGAPEKKTRKKRQKFAVFTQSGRKLMMWEYGTHEEWRTVGKAPDGSWEYIQFEGDYTDWDETGYPFASYEDCMPLPEEV